LYGIVLDFNKSCDKRTYCSKYKQGITKVGLLMPNNVNSKLYT